MFSTRSPTLLKAYYKIWIKSETFTSYLSKYFSLNIPYLKMGKLPKIKNHWCTLLESSFFPLGTLLKAYRRAIFLHGMRHLMVLVATSFTSKKAILTHIKVETLEATIPKSAYWGSFANITFCLVSCRFSRCKSKTI